MEDKILDAALKALKDPKIDFRLLGGMSNYTYVIDSKNKKIYR